MVQLKLFDKCGETLNTEDLIQKLISKSNEAFILAIELFNKPTILYRVEGFSFFICNAWELLLKARIIATEGLEKIYFKDKPERTISIENCIKKVFTNSKDPLRINLEKIVELRNTSTHFITEEYEQIYAPLFQASVINYSNKLAEFFNVDITDKISNNFLNLSMKMSEINPKEIQARYPEPISEKLLDTLSKIEHSQKELGNKNFSIFIYHDFYITKNQKSTTAQISISKEASNAAFILKESKDKQTECPHIAKNFIMIINKWLKRDKIVFVNPKTRDDNKRHTFNKACFDVFVKFFDMKNNPKFCYKYDRTSSPTYSYSNAALQFVYEQIKQDPENIMQTLYEKAKCQPQELRNSK